MNAIVPDGFASESDAGTKLTQDELKKIAAEKVVA